MSPDGQRTGHLKQGQARPRFVCFSGAGWVVQARARALPSLAICGGEREKFSCGWPVSASFSGCMTLQEGKSCGGLRLAAAR